MGIDSLVRPCLRSWNLPSQYTMSHKLKATILRIPATVTLQVRLLTQRAWALQPSAPCHYSLASGPAGHGLDFFAEPFPASYHVLY